VREERSEMALDDHKIYETLVPAVKKVKLEMTIYIWG